MPVDPTFLRRHYASLSDDAFDAIDPQDLVDDARRIYDEELKERRRTRPHAAAAAAPEPESEAPDTDQDESEPDWLADAAVATTFASYPGNDAAGEVDDAVTALNAAGIPCKVLAEKPDPERARVPEMEYRLMVPGKLNLEAGSVLEGRVFNRDYVEAWKAHFEELDEEELREVDLESIFGALRDRIEQIESAYREELEHRKKGGQTTLSRP